jgi:hypothetical protein
MGSSWLQFAQPQLEPVCGYLSTRTLDITYKTNTIGYYLANEVATTYHGMMIANPEVEWDVFYRMSAPDMAATLLDLAQRVNLRALRKSPRGPKKPRSTRDSNAKHGHVSTAKLLMARHG